MKLSATFTLILTITFCNSLNAQPYLQDGIEWYYSMVKFIGHTNYSNRHYIQGDTIIQDKTCKILHKENATCDTRPEVDYLWENDNQVYYYNFEEENFKLLYDYNAHVGDTIAIGLWEGSSSVEDEQLSYIVEDVDIVQYNNLTLKKFSIKYLRDEYSTIELPYSSQDSATIIEGIGVMGNYFHVIGNGFCDWQYNIDLRCVYHPELDTLKFGELECDSNYLILNAPHSRPLQDGIEIYPNPTSENFNIKAMDGVKIKEISLFDALGKMINKYSAKTNHSTINVEDLESGVYYLLIEDREQQFYSKKLIIN